MGCDIHCWAEVKVRDKWQAAGPVFDNPYFRPEDDCVHSDSADGSPDDWYVWNEPKIEHPLRCRDYEMFAVLAGVRNYSGIAPVSEPRDLPADVSAYVRNQSLQWGEDGHSHSWLTLAELKAAAPDSQEIDDEHLVLSRDESGKITSTCLATTGPHLGPVGRRTVFSLWGREPWVTLLSNLESLKNNRDDDGVRIVFFFDN